MDYSFELNDCLIRLDYHPLLYLNMIPGTLGLNLCYTSLMQSAGVTSRAVLF